jgi:hypothetical protein
MEIFFLRSNASWLLFKSACCQATSLLADVDFSFFGVFPEWTSAETSCHIQKDYRFLYESVRHGVESFVARMTVFFKCVMLPAYLSPV